MTRRVLCLVLPALACELILPRLRLTAEASTRKKSRTTRMPAVAVAAVITQGPRALTPTDTLDAVNETARSFGIATGQSIADAHTRLGQLQVCALTQDSLQEALGKVAEAVMEFGLNTALHTPDSVCLDITGVAHLFGGEEALALQVTARVRSMGHSVKAAVANGPLVAQALARWGNFHDSGVQCFTPAQISAELAKLPLAALPLAEGSDDDLIPWLTRCGLYSVGDLKRLPAASVSARLGAVSPAVLEFIQGFDDTPLVPHKPAAIPSEQFESEEGMKGSEPLLFVIKGLAARLCARLQGRGEAIADLCVQFTLDRSIAALQGSPAEISCNFDFPSAISRAPDLERIVAARIKRLQLAAPVVAVSLQASAIRPAEAAQLDLSRVFSGLGGTNGLSGRNQGPEFVPILLAEIMADIDASRVGLLQEVPSHRPECKSVLAPLPQQDNPRRHNPRGNSERKRSKKNAPLQPSAQRDFAMLGNPQQEPEPQVAHAQPTRLFAEPLAIAVKFEPGATFVMGSTLFTVAEVQFERRLAQVEWWSGTAISRDYWRLWLNSPNGGCAALAFVDRKTGHRFLQALYD